MKLSELEKSICEKNVLNTLNSVVLDMNMLPPNGATIHREKNCIAILELYIGYIKNSVMPDYSNFREFKESNYERYHIVLETIHEAVNKLGIII